MLEEGLNVELGTFKSLTLDVAFKLAFFMKTVQAASYRKLQAAKSNVEDSLLALVKEGFPVW